MSAECQEESCLALALSWLAIVLRVLMIFICASKVHVVALARP